MQERMQKIPERERERKREREREREMDNLQLTDQEAVSF